MLNLNSGDDMLQEYVRYILIDSDLTVTVQNDITLEDKASCEVLLGVTSKGVVDFIKNK